MARASSSEDEFSGFDDDDIQQATYNVLPDVNESDIDVSDVDTPTDSDTSDDFSDSDGEDNDVRWSPDLHDVNINRFTHMSS